MQKAIRINMQFVTFEMKIYKMKKKEQVDRKKITGKKEKKSKKM